MYNQFKQFKFLVNRENENLSGNSCQLYRSGKDFVTNFIAFLIKVTLEITS